MNIFSFFRYYTATKRLNKLRKFIKETESKLDNIREIGTANAGVTSEYVRKLRADHLAAQREYNLLLEQNRPFTEGVAEIIVDTFKDYWLEKKQYNLLEPVEVDLDKRIRESSFLHIAKKIGENVRYEIFSVEGSFIRRDRTDRSTVYLGEGSAKAIVFKEWIYWYESGSILSEKYIYRRSIDGTGCERLDWLSNEKTLEIAGDFGHYVSEDNVKKINSNSDELIIEVFRKSKNETYKIIITESNGELKVKKLFPQSMLQESE